MTAGTAPAGGLAFAVPPGACDAHAHVIAADTAAYPMVPDRSYTPAPAPEAQYLAMLDALGMTRGVLVQISVYGTDNRCMLQVLERHRERLRGVAVADPAITERELLHMHALGVRGLRVNVVFGGGVGLHVLEALAARIAPLGWHLQLLIDARTLPALLPRLRRLPCRCVLDHMGHMPAALGAASPGFQALLHLVTDYGWWVKLSGAYRLAAGPYPYAAAAALAGALLERAPERLVWGSDWPHVATTPAPDTGALLNLLAQWAPDPAARRRILVDNPATLYDFPPYPAR